MERLNKIYIVTGEKGRGKTTFLTRFIEIMKKEKPEGNDSLVGGIISPAMYNEKNERAGYYVQDVISGEKRVLCSTGNMTDTKTGAYYFDNQAIQFGNNALRLAISMNYPIIVIDEIGNLEIKNSGWAEILNEFFVMKNKILILSVRPNLISKVKEKWDFYNPRVIYCNEIEPNEFAFEIQNSKEINFQLNKGTP